MGKKAALRRKLSGRRFSEESMKASGNGGGWSGNKGGGNTERASAGRARVVSGGFRANLRSGGAAAVGVRVEASGVNNGFGSQRGENLGAKEVGESIKGLKKKKHVVPVVGDSKKIIKNRKGVKRDRNDFVAGVDLKKNRGCRKRMRKNKNVIYSGGDVVDEDDESSEEIQFLYAQDKDGKLLDESEGKIQENDKVLDGSESVVELCEDGTEMDESEDEIQLLFGQDQNGKVVESHMDGEKVVSSIRKGDKSGGVKISEGKNCGEKNPGRSSLRVLENGKEVSADASTDSEVPRKIQDPSESDSTETSDCEDLEESELSSDEDSDRSSDEDYELHNPSNCVYPDEDLSSSSDDDDREGEGEDKDDDLKRGVEEVLKDEEDELEELLKDEDEFEGVEEVLKDEELEELLKDEDEFEEVLKDEDESKVMRGSVKSGLKKRKFCGINILCDSDGDAKVTGENKSVAARLCLRRMSKPPTSKKKQKLGTFSSPFTLTDDEPDSSADEDGDLNTHFKDGNDRKYEQKAGMKGKGKPGRPKKGKGFPFTLTDDKLNSSADDDGNLNTHSKDGNDRKYVQKAGVKGKGKPGRPKKGKGFPFTLTDDKLNSSADEDGDLNTHSKDGSNRKYVQKAGEHGSGKPGRPEKGKGKRGRPKKGKEKLGRPAKRWRDNVNSAAISVDKVLADSIWDKGDVSLEELISSKEELPDCKALPLKFRFEDEDPTPTEKSYWDIEADKLFAEMDFVLAACRIGSSYSSKVDDEFGGPQQTESNPATFCHEGKHQLVLDEQIGLVCKFCSFVELEIKYILPSFGKRSLGRLDTKVSIDGCNIHELQFQDSASVFHSGSKRYVHAEGTVWDIIPGIKYSMFQHQREGFEFIWKNIAGGIDLEELKKHDFVGGSGCIISHAPGTGKTRLTIVFLQTYMELYQMCRPVIIAPLSMLLTWEEEFRKWNVDIPFHNLNKEEFSGQENATAVNLVRRVGRGVQTKKSIRLVKLYSWKKERSILGVSYGLFERLTGFGVSGNGGKKNKNAEDEQVRKMLLELPGLLVLDEGHIPRNDKSLIWKALLGVVTQKRIILSGTPFQNNFTELFNTLTLVRPKFVDKIISETCGGSQRKRGRKSSVARGKWASLTSSISKDGNGKLDMLRDMIDPFVHVHKGTILKERLPGLRESMVILRPTHPQKLLIEDIQGRAIQFELDYLLTLISVHPSLLLRYHLSEKEELSVDRDKLEMLRFKPEAGVKTRFIVELIQLSGSLKEKVLIFSQYIEPLTFIKELLKSYFGWTEGKEVLYMDGTLDVKHRQSSIGVFNDPASEAHVLLASTKACSEGINLVGASRVVLIDVVWNPSVERQAISRAYRIGQKKLVYIYRLITSETMEGEKYERQAEKDRLSELVFSSADGHVVHNPETPCLVTEDEILQEMVQHEKISNMFEKILNQRSLL